MSKKKILTIALCVALVAALVIGGSIAYFTDKTQTETNVFTLGKVDISLAEPKWDPEAEHTVMPGTFYDKDPTITVEDGSEDCWVFVELEFSRYVPMIQYLQNTVDGFATMTPIQQTVALTDRFLVDFENENWKIMN
ncbi:MAG: SipW-dependent-type signal peptide-containing protein, partial [Oscillospiraceae bacterium]|nr:SipW-dependent-type signal peptide-containing protein [Oscillospiraceae bacterium]